MEGRCCYYRYALNGCGVFIMFYFFRGHFATSFLSSDYVGACWITTALTGLLVFMMFLLIMSTITTGGLRVPRCVPRDEISNHTIHLVHTSHAEEWQSFEIDLFERIAENYPNYKIHLIIIQENIPINNFNHIKHVEGTEKINSSSTTTEGSSLKTTEGKGTTNIEIKRKKRRIDDMRLSINMSAKRLLDILLHGKPSASNDTERVEIVRTPRSIETTTQSIKTVDDLLQIHPNIILDNTTYSHIFYMSPLYAYWPFLNIDLRIFAVRVLQLWQYGGISFDLNPTIKQLENVTTITGNLDNKTSDEKNADSIFNKKLLNFIITEKKNYEKLPTGVVTADDEALHMESKIPCHAFFGEILMNLRRAQDDTTVKDILQQSLKVFCKHSAANKKYCDIITKVQ